MFTIAIANSKGGSAKSTLAVNLATCARSIGCRSLLIDCDFVQQSLVSWGELRKQQCCRDLGASLPPIPVLAAPTERVADVLKQAREKNATLAVIDTAAGQTNALTRVFELSDLVIIPTQPTLNDIEGSKPTARLAHMLRKPYRFLLTRVTPGHTRRVALWRARYGQEGTLLEGQFTNRVAFQDAMVVGMGASEWSPGCEAAREAYEVFDNVMDLAERSRDEGRPGPRPPFRA